MRSIDWSSDVCSSDLPSGDRAYTIYSQSIDRSGFARATLAPREGMAAEVPPMDPVQVLTMMDMGMAHDMAGMDMGGEWGGSMKGMDHVGMSNSEQYSSSAGDHGTMRGMDNGS